MSDPNLPVDDRRDEKKEARDKKRRAKEQFKLDKIKAVTAKALAVAKKRKWLVLLIGAGIAVYMLVSSGSLGGIFNVIKGLF